MVRAELLHIFNWFESANLFDYFFVFELEAHFKTFKGANNRTFGDSFCSDQPLFHHLVSWLKGPRAVDDTH